MTKEKEQASEKDINKLKLIEKAKNKLQQRMNWQPETDEEKDLFNLGVKHLSLKLNSNEK